MLHAIMFGVEINDEGFRDRTRWHADHGIRPSGPPTNDNILVCGGILEPMLDQRVLRAWIAWEDWDTALSICEGIQQHGPARCFVVEALESIVIGSSPHGEPTSARGS